MIRIGILRLTTALLPGFFGLIFLPPVIAAGGMLEPGVPVSGYARGNDKPDWYSVRAPGRKHYLFSVGPGTLRYPALKFKRADGKETKWFNLGPLRVIQLHLKSDVEFVAVGGFKSETGSYTLTYSPDDYSSSVRWPLLLPTGQNVRGNFELPGDKDIFLFEGVKNITYVVTLSLETARRGMIEVKDRQLKRVAGRFAPPGRKRIQFKFKPVSSGKFFLIVKPMGGSYRTSGTGTYRFSIIGDAHSDTPNGATGGRYVGTYDGNLHEGDVDWFKFSAFAFSKYTITAQSTKLKAIKIELFSSFGRKVAWRVIASDSGPVAKIDWNGIFVRLLPKADKNATVMKCKADWSDCEYGSLTTLSNGTLIRTYNPMYIRVTSRIRNDTGSYKLTMKSKTRKTAPKIIREIDRIKNKKPH